jgi:hypothetical protein
MQAGAAYSYQIHHLKVVGWGDRRDQLLARADLDTSETGETLRPLRALWARGVRQLL